MVGGPVGQEPLAWRPISPKSILRDWANMLFVG
jgi:hypothetical protein